MYTRQSMACGRVDTSRNVRVDTILKVTCYVRAVAISHIFF